MFNARLASSLSPFFLGTLLVACSGEDGTNIDDDRGLGGDASTGGQSDDDDDSSSGGKFSGTGGSSSNTGGNASGGEGTGGDGTGGDGTGGKGTGGDGTGGGTGGSDPVCVTIDTIVAISPALELGATTSLSATLNDSDETSTIYLWSVSQGELDNDSNEAPSFACDAEGAATVTLQIEEGDCEDEATVAIECTGPAGVIVSEVESSGGEPGDWVEFSNPTASAVDLSGWLFQDNDDSHSYILPSGTVIEAGAYLVLDADIFGFGLGGADSVRLFSSYGILVDSYSWTEHAKTTYGLCPNEDGFHTTTVPTKGTANDCSKLIVVNEIESSGGDPGDWTELYNAGPEAVDISGWTFKDNDDSHVYVIPEGATIESGGYYLIEEAAQGFGLGSGDSARLYSADMTLVDSHTWSGHAATSYGRCPDGTGEFVTPFSVTKGGPNDCSTIKINEAESSGGSPGDWVELYNTSTMAVDVSGWIFKDNDDSHVYVVPTTTIIEPGGYLVLDEADFGFGLGGNESARLYDASEVLVDQTSWLAHASTTYARCPNGTGAFAESAVSTKGSENICEGESELAVWPGQNSATTVDGENVFGGNLSALAYQPEQGENPAWLWGARNGPSSLYRLENNGGVWSSSTTDNWDAGKTLLYTNGSGEPDAEGVTLAEYSSPLVYVSTERNNAASGTSRLSILAFDTSESGTSLTAVRDWNLTAELPSTGANAGLEGITWIPDSFLTSLGFYDWGLGKAYDPVDYPDHGTGLFFVGVEGSGLIYAFALDQSADTFSHIATFESGFAGIMDVTFDRETGYLWAVCDDSCDGQMNVLVIDSDAASASYGEFVLSSRFARPTSMPNLNNEGFAIAPESECSAGFKSVFWSDDGETGGHSIRRDSIPCGSFF